MQHLAPLKNSTFLFLWVAALVSNIGTWMNEVGAAWLMTELSDDPLMVSLVVTSTSLPIFLFVLIAGVLADITDRRQYLLRTQALMLVFAIGLTVFTWAGLMNPWLLLFFTFAIGTGAALMMPAWDAIIPEIVSKEDLPQAVSLGSIGINAARAIGPALAGLIIASIGTYAVFALNALSFIGVIAALVFWKRQVPDVAMAPERFIGALKAGIRFTRHTRPLQIVLLRSALFFIPAIGLLSLLPIYVREILQGDAQILGYLQGSMGLGAIFTAFILPALKQSLSTDILLFLVAIVLASSFGVLAWAPAVLNACIALFMGGMAWITTFSILRVKAQQAVPNWVRARAMSVMLMVSFGAMSLGAMIWGQTANMAGLQNAYVLMAATSILFALLSFPLSLRKVGMVDQERAEDFRQHEHFLYAPSANEGPVQVALEYAVADNENFLVHIKALAEIRQRNGAYRWTLFKDLEKPHTYIEQFFVESWEGHERQHARTNKDEKAVHDRLFACLGENQKPIIRHLVHQNIRNRT